MQISRLQALLLLALANLLWSGNWVAGRALRETFDPVSLNFWRWLIAAAVLAPISVVQKPTWRMPCFSHSFSVTVSKRLFRSGRRPGMQR